MADLLGPPKIAPNSPQKTMDSNSPHFSDFQDFQDIDERIKTFQTDPYVKDSLDAGLALSDIAIKVPPLLIILLIIPYYILLIIPYYTSDNTILYTSDNTILYTSDTILYDII